MATSDIIAQTIFNQAIAGTPYNPGVPSILANLIVAQSKHETDGYQSNAFLKNNNAVGYKAYAGSRYQVDSGITSTEGDAYGHYANYQDSIKELIDWIYRRKREGKFPGDLATITTPDKYAALLKASGYYGDAQTVYSTALKRWYLQYAKVAGISGGAVLLGSFLLYFFIKRKI